MSFLFCLSGFSCGVLANCQPSTDGQLTNIELGSPSNVTAPGGSDVQFVCCGGTKWTYESDGVGGTGPLSREIGPHPDAAGAPEGDGKFEPPFLSNTEDSSVPGAFGASTGTTSLKPSAGTATTVYTMHDDKGRLLLIINRASEADQGHYRCHGYSGAKDAYLVITAESEAVAKGNAPTEIARGALIQRHVMFPADELDKVTIHCPVTDAQVIQSWLWREPILPTSDDYEKVPQGKPPSRTVTSRSEGLHDGGYVELGPDLAWARLVDPLSPEAPVKLWCQFEMPSPWKDKEPILAYYVMDWELYQPIAPRLYLLPLDATDKSATHGSYAVPVNPGTGEMSHSLGGMSATIPGSDVNPAQVLLQEIAQAELTSRKMGSEGKQPLLENRPARFACRFRVLEPDGLTEIEVQRVPTQHVYWYRNGQQVNIPPFHVDNTMVASHGISLLNVRTYPALFGNDLASMTSKSGESKEPKEEITCSVISQIKDKPIYKVTTNASMQVDVILVPRIMNKTFLSTERRVDDAAKLTCNAIANGPPNMEFEFSPSGKTDQSNDNLPEWRPVEIRYGLTIRRIEPAWDRPTEQRLVLDISDLRRSDHGLYRCSVWNQAGRDQAIGKLLVRSDPEIEISPMESNYFVGHRPWVASCLVCGYPLALHGLPVRPASRSIAWLMRMASNDQSTDHRPIDTQSMESRDSFGRLNQADNKSVRMKIFTPEGEPMDRVEVRLINYKADDLQGINATYEVHMNQRLGSKALVRCEYTHTDRRIVARDILLREATKPPAPNITVLCAGPRAVVFGVTNPRVNPESLPTERIVTQKVIFAPAKTFHNAASLASLLVYLDSDGQPINGTGHVAVASTNAARPNTAIIPVRNLMADTEYVFEWSSGNEFGLSVMVQFTLWTISLEQPPIIKNVVFLKPTDQYLRFSTFLADPCPYNGGARAELSDLIIRYRLTESNGSKPSDLVGRGQWSEMQACKNLMDITGVTESREEKNAQSINSNSESSVHRGDDEQQEFGINWAGDKPIPCEIVVSDPQSNYEVQVATRNRFNRSTWFTTIYRPALAVHYAALCFPTCDAISLISRYPIAIAFVALSVILTRFSVSPC